MFCENLNFEDFYIISKLLSLSYAVLKFFVVFVGSVVILLSLDQLLLLLEFSFFNFRHQLHLLVVTGFQNFFKLCIFVNSHLMVKPCLSGSFQIIS